MTPQERREMVMDCLVDGVGDWHDLQYILWDYGFDVIDTTEETN